MTDKLKTLKDLTKKQMIWTGQMEGESIDISSVERKSMVHTEELKQEAIKWVKWWEHLYEVDMDEISHQWANCFRHFFNLTEKDLK